MAAEKDILLQLIEQKLDWGTSDTWLTKDFENLSQRIFEETSVSLSMSTLRRVWGKVTSTHLPSGTTLDTLAKFAGFADWRSFLKQQAPANNVSEVSSSVPILTAKPLKYRKAVLLLVLLFLIISLVGSITFKKFQSVSKSANSGGYRFSSKPLTHDLPNSVIFTYDARVAPTDCVFVQQSWNPGTRIAVDKTLHEYTSIYYEPGSFQAKLLVGNQIVKEQPLLISTNGWCGLIANQPVPVYLKPSEFLERACISLPISKIKEKNIALQPQPPVVKYYNVGNFDPVPVTSFSFSADVKNEYQEEAGACGMSYVALITDGVPIEIPLSAVGCVSELNLFNGKDMISGKKADLSCFGVDFSDWIRVRCKSTKDKLQYFINDKLVYASPLPKKEEQVVGLGFGFQGTGSVRNIHLTNGKVEVFQPF